MPRPFLALVLLGCRPDDHSAASAADLWPEALTDTGPICPEGTGLETLDPQVPSGFGYSAAERYADFLDLTNNHEWTWSTGALTGLSIEIRPLVALETWSVETPSWASDARCVHDLALEVEIRFDTADDLLDARFTDWWTGTATWEEESGVYFDSHDSLVLPELPPAHPVSSYRLIGGDDEETGRWATLWEYWPLDHHTERRCQRGLLRAAVSGCEDLPRG